MRPRSFLARSNVWDYKSPCQAGSQKTLLSMSYTGPCVYKLITCLFVALCHSWLYFSHTCDGTQTDMQSDSHAIDNQKGYSTCPSKHPKGANMCAKKYFQMLHWKQVAFNFYFILQRYKCTCCTVAYMCLCICHLYPAWTKLSIEHSDNAFRIHVERSTFQWKPENQAYISRTCMYVLLKDIHVCFRHLNFHIIAQCFTTVWTTSLLLRLCTYNSQFWQHLGTWKSPRWANSERLISSSEQRCLILR